MLEVLQFYVSGFWIWAGITLGMAIMLTVLADTALIFLGKKR